MISRRQVLLGSAASLAAPHRLYAQPQQRMRRVGFIGSSTPTAAGHFLKAYVAGMRDLGWVEGRNLVLDVRYAGGDPARYTPLAAELLALKPDVLVAGIDSVAKAAAALTKLVPIVFVLGLDPVGLGLVQSFTRPGGNVTGFSILAFELVMKRASLLKEAVPRLERLGVMYREGDADAQRWLAPLAGEMRKIGVTLIPAGAKQADDLPKAFEKMQQDGAQGVLEMPEPLFFQERQRIAELALKYRLPTTFTTVEHAHAGMLMAYAVDLAAIFRRAATLVDKILKGANPATMPIEQASVYELFLNLRTARALGLTLPASLLIRATRVIE